MSTYAHIKRCLELSDRDVATAIGDRRLAKALLDQLAKVSKPGDGAPKLLLVFAKMAAEQVDWIDGALRIEMVGDADVTVVEVLCELGLGMHERVFPSFKMNVPLDEFARAVERVPHMVEPLAIANKSGRRLVLTAAGEEGEARVSAAPASIEIAEDALMGSAGSETLEKAKRINPSPFVKIEPAPKRTASSSKHRAVRKSSRPEEMPAAQPTTPKVISPTTGKTLRPAPQIEPVKIQKKSGPPPLPPDLKAEKRDSARPKKESVKPARRESVKPAKRESLKPARQSAKPAAKGKSHGPPPTSQRGEVVPKAPLLPNVEPKPAAPRGAAIARVALTKVAAPRGAVVAPKPAASRSKPPPAVAKRASKPPPAPQPAPPPPKAKSIRPPRPSISEPPDEEGIDMGWEDES